MRGACGFYIPASGASSSLLTEALSYRRKDGPALTFHAVNVDLDRTLKCFVCIADADIHCCGRIGVRVKRVGGDISELLLVAIVLAADRCTR